MTSPLETTLLLTDQQGSVLHTVNVQADKPLAYTVYGHRPAESGMTCLLGFNGEPPDPVTGHYLLGNGYRAFNPVLMRFNSPDSESPFEQGGVNPYAYCEGNPVDYVDPEGRWRLPLAVTKFFGRLFGKTAATGAKASRSAAKAGQGSPSSGGALSRSTNAGTRVFRTAGNAVSDGGKIQPRGALKDGQVRGGFWDQLTSGEIQLRPGQLAAKGSRANPDVKGPKMYDALGEPPSGLQQWKERPRATKSMFRQNFKTSRFSQSQKAEAATALSGHFTRIRKT